MEILVDTSIWIDYFRSGENSTKLDFLINEYLLVINDIILAELLPLLTVRQDKEVIGLLKKIKNNCIEVNWQEIIDFQILCLKSGSTGIGIPDLMITQNAIEKSDADIFH